ncbi:MAG: Ribulose-phosphate 3-epimerase [Candidatus Peregrinibacteria bacterium GW2011_GWA2_33_10]|nr:MAG: Ribulose-phosphate 3-epimerase [Candidatus Peregrinibacteria bacterium GW2011_GWA2_33_10]KKP40874.1 MAG: ribulose-5-phosphate 3-epimerase, ribulose-phosphate 3-epimerase [Candidatus Peregrinibacteria bacterium GW2011_GWC2_33_13]OGJ50761.1 MAG: ribulose-phosphate 3-epimerase [Candidatus Peregrinibacteria bacterium RIFOXYA2_FULL_33_7]
MPPSIKIAPSILSCDLGNLNNEIKSIENEIDMIHVDVMDGHFVPNITMGPCIVENIKSKKEIDCHLMIENPEKYIESFAKAGADIINFHFEATKDPLKLIHQIKSLGKKAGITIKPKTDVKVLDPYLKELDMILVMSVEPGFSGQSFMENSLSKIKYLRSKAPNLDIQIDGGINDQTAELAKKAGANVLVSASYIFKAKDRIEAIKKLKE